MKSLKRQTAIRIVSYTILLISVFIRILSIPVSNFDLNTYNLVWYQTLAEQGILETLGTNFTNYTPIYSYLLAFAVLMKASIQPIHALKIIPTIFDILGAIYIYKIVKMEYGEGNIPLLSAAVYFTAPTIMINSTYWGQVDSIYTFFLILCLHEIINKRPSTAMIAFGLSLATKAQAVFFLPFLAVMTLHRKIGLKHFLLIPLTYLLSVLPVVILGRPLVSALTTYADQSSTYKVLAANAPNFYTFFSRDFYFPVAMVGGIVASALLCYWIYSSRNMPLTGTKEIALLAAISLSLTPFLLPKMHDRYFYPSDVFSILLAFMNPSLWFVPVLLQTSSFLTYTVFLFDGPALLTALAVVINTIAIAILLRSQRRPGSKSSSNSWPSRALPFMTALLIPIILAGFSIQAVLSRYFLRIEYSLPYFSAESSGFTKTERYQWGSALFEYLTQDKAVGVVARLKTEDGAFVFNTNERALFEEASNTTQGVLQMRDAALLMLFVIMLLAWIQDRLSTIRQGIRYGAWLSLPCALLLVLTSFITYIVKPDIFTEFLSNNGISQVDTTMRLFPALFWRDWVITAGLICAIAAGMLVGCTRNLQGNSPQKAAVIE